MAQQRRKLAADEHRTTVVVKAHVWKRARVFAVTNDMELQELVSMAIEQFLDRNHG